MWAFAKLRHCLDSPTMKSVYYALVYSHLQYCNLIWGDAIEGVLSPLQTIHNRIVRIITFAPFQSGSTQQFYDELEILNPKQVHNLEKAKFLFKYKQGKLPSNFRGYIQEAGENHRYRLRSGTNQNYQQTRFRTRFGKRKIQYDGVKIWNETPTAIKDCKTLKSFSGLYKAYIMNKVL